MRFLCILICILICGCSKTEKTDIFAMDTIISLEVYGTKTSEALEKMNEEIMRIDEKFSPKSNFVLDETKDILKISDRVSELTNGSFDITLGQVMQVWGFRDGTPGIPEHSDIVSARKEKVYDFGGIAKGYAGDRLSRIADEYGVSGIFSLGGNIQAVGTKKDGKPWRVGIANPENTKDYIGYVEVCDKAVVTSGVYQRFFEENGKIYHHIIDPKTGYPADSELLSVTVIADSGTFADALSTALFVAGKEAAMELYNSGEIEFEAIFIDRDGNVFETENACLIRKE